MNFKVDCGLSNAKDNIVLRVVGFDSIRRDLLLFQGDSRQTPTGIVLMTRYGIRFDSARFSFVFFPADSGLENTPFLARYRFRPDSLLRDPLREYRRSDL